MRVSILPLLLSGWVAFGQQPDRSPTGGSGSGKTISVEDVCGAVAPAEDLAGQVQWAPDGGSLVYWKSVETGFRLHLELETVDATDGNHDVLLTSDQVDHLFPALVSEDKGHVIPPPRASIGFAWSWDGTGLLVFGPSQVYWLDRKTRKTRSLVSGKQEIADVQLSPDGRWAGFIRDHNLWVVGIANGMEHAITEGGTETLHKGELDWMYPAELGIGHGYVWSPDSSRLAYLEFNLKQVASYTPPFSSEEDTVPARTIDYPAPGTPNPVVHVFVAGVAAKSRAVAMDTGRDDSVYLPRLQWLPDGSHVAIERLDRPQAKLDLLIADARTGVARTVLSDKDDYWINLSDTLYFLKSTPQFIWSSERSGYRHLYLYSMDGKLIRQLTDGKWEVTALNAVNERERKLYYTSTEKDSLDRQLYVGGLDGSNGKRVTNESGTHEAEFAPDGSAYIDRFSTAIRPWTRTVYRIDPKSETPTDARRSGKKVFTLLEDTGAAKGTGPALRAVAFVKVKTHDDMELNAMLIRPAGFTPDKKYPAIVYISGGPGGQGVHDAWDGDISMWNQLLVQRGYIVFAIDNRGTAGRGHVFEEYLHLRFAGQEVTDLEDGVTFLESLPYIDGSRLGVWGKDFGGFLTVTSMLHSPIPFKAGFAVAPVVNWLRYDSAYAERYLGDRVKNFDGYLSSSPLDDAKSLKGALLVGQGTADLKVHPDQTMQLQRELVRGQKYGEITYFPGLGREIDQTDACTVLYTRAEEFFSKSL